MKLSVIIPVYNEATNILTVLDKVQAVPVTKEIIVVDDGSTDGTRDRLRERREENLKVILHERNRGKGAAIRTGLDAVTGDIVLIQDADLEYEPAEYPQLLQPILEGRAKVVYGSRFLRPLTSKKIYHRFVLGVRFLNVLANLLYRARITDEATCYKVFRTEVIKGLHLRCERFEFCPEVTAKVRKKGYEIHEVPISYKGRRFDEGKKIRCKDGIEAIWVLLKYRFVD